MKSGSESNREREPTTQTCNIEAANTYIEIDTVCRYEHTHSVWSTYNKSREVSGNSDAEEGSYSSSSCGGAPPVWPSTTHH